MLWCQHAQNIALSNSKLKSVLKCSMRSHLCQTDRRTNIMAIARPFVLRMHRVLKINEMEKHLDKLHWFSQRRSQTPHSWVAHPGGYVWPPNSKSSEIFVQCTYPQVSSSYVYSFGSYRVDRQTDRQTDGAEYIQCCSLRYDVG